MSEISLDPELDIALEWVNNNTDSTNPYEKKIWADVVTSLSVYLQELLEGTYDEVKIRKILKKLEEFGLVVFDEAERAFIANAEKKPKEVVLRITPEGSRYFTRTRFG